MTRWQDGQLSLKGGGEEGLPATLLRKSVSQSDVWSSLFVREVEREGDTPGNTTGLAVCPLVRARSYQHIPLVSKMSKSVGKFSFRMSKICPVKLLLQESFPIFEKPS